MKMVGFDFFCKTTTVRLQPRAYYKLQDCLKDVYTWMLQYTKLFGAMYCTCKNVFPLDEVQKQMHLPRDTYLDTCTTSFLIDCYLNWLTHSISLICKPISSFNSLWLYFDSYWLVFEFYSEYCKLYWTESYLKTLNDFKCLGKKSFNLI